MKFLIFNIAVTVALIYLVMGESQMSWLRDATSRAETMTEQAASGFSETKKPESQAAPKQIGKIAPATRSKLAEEGELASIELGGEAKPLLIDPTPRPDTEPTPALLSPKNRSGDGKIKLAPLADPVTVDMRQAMPVQVPGRTSTAMTPSIDGGEGEATRVTEVPKFMTPMERSRELSKLARSAEDLFLDRLAK